MDNSVLSRFAPPHLPTIEDISNFQEFIDLGRMDNLARTIRFYVKIYCLAADKEYPPVLKYYQSPMYAVPHSDKSIPDSDSIPQMKDP